MKTMNHLEFIFNKEQNQICKQWHTLFLMQNINETFNTLKSYPEELTVLFNLLNMLISNHPFNSTKNINKFIPIYEAYSIEYIEHYSLIQSIWKEV